MALKNQEVEFWDGESRNLVLRNITDSDGAIIDWSTASAISLKITAEQGAGTAIITKSLGDFTTTSTSATVTITDANWTSGSGVAGTVYWWELAANFGSGLLQIVAPSRCFFHKSAT